MSREVENWEARIGRRLRLRDLHVFLAVVEWGSMAKAAHRLGVTQPAVSKSVADLEHTLGVRLLDRNPQGVEVTLYGSVLVRRALAAFDELRQGVAEIKFIADPTAGEVRIGCNESLSAALLPAVIEGLSEQHPGVTVHVTQMSRPITTGPQCRFHCWSRHLSDPGRRLELGDSVRRTSDRSCRRAKQMGASPQGRTG